MSVARISTLLRNARIFDGAEVLDEHTLLLHNGIIAAIGDTGDLPHPVRELDAAGQTILPGLIDAHTHIFAEIHLQQALTFGITTELDMFMDPHRARLLKQQQVDGQGCHIADLRSAGFLATAPGGHGTQFGSPIPTISSPEEAESFVQARIAEGSDYIKIMREDGSVAGKQIPTISTETMAALVAAAHRHHKLAIVHALTLHNAQEALEAGVDGLGHLIIDAPPSPTFGQQVASQHAFVITTLAVIEATCGGNGGATLATDPRIAPYLSPMDQAALQPRLPPPSPLRSYAAAEATLRSLHGAGVPILAGTDAPNLGTVHGASLHRELELLVQAGLSPTAALAAATSVPARIFHLDDRGRIATGLRADLLLVTGDPTDDITATRNITHIWKQGIPVDRNAYRAA